MPTQNPTHPLPIPACLSLNTVAEAAEILACHPQTLYRHTDQGLLPHVKVAGRILYRASTLEDYATNTDGVPALIAHQVTEAAKSFERARLISHREACTWLRIGYSTLSRLTAAQAVRVGYAGPRLKRYRPQDIAEFINTNSKAATAGAMAGRIA